MRWTKYRNRRVAEIENDDLLLTVAQEGGHVARLLHKSSGINPLWTPQWPSIEPSEYSPERHPEFGDSNEAQLVAGLLGHSVCLDLFGAPTPSEAASGMPVHGEAPVVPYALTGDGASLTMRADLPLAEMRFTRNLQLAKEGVVRFRETLENLSATDRPIGWTQHVTLGAPFLERGTTRFLLTSRQSRVMDSSFNNGLGAQAPDADFEWPLCPRRDGKIDDLSIMTAAPVSAGFTAHLMEPASEHVCFVAWSPAVKLLIGYVWRQRDFPWLARWEENHLRTWAPWNGEGFALGMEFGVSPFVENRRDMVARGGMFGAPAFRWLDARSACEVNYVAFVRSADALPVAVQWDGEVHVQMQSSLSL